ncbi:hypothetical protein SK128_009721 [Halocaridina rubra]|uniref:Uncharacterized protein n=1 Tax=Halocaridina rubra TaxID=373956 RepID=A0AAN8XK69_HALRR
MWPWFPEVKITLPAHNSPSTFQLEYSKKAKKCSSVKKKILTQTLQQRTARHMEVLNSIMECMLCCWRMWLCTVQSSTMCSLGYSHCLWLDGVFEI